MGNSASVTPNGTELTTPRPDIDVEICPPGTMAAMDALLDRYVTLANSGDAGNWNPEEEPQVIACRSILTAHRAQLDLGPTIKPGLTVAPTCKPSLQVDYASETEDLSTWPKSRGPGWRARGPKEIMRGGDVGAYSRGGPYFICDEACYGGHAVEEIASREVWTRRPAPEAQP